MQSNNYTSYCSRTLRRSNNKKCGAKSKPGIYLTYIYIAFKSIEAVTTFVGIETYLPFTNQNTFD